MLAGAAPDPRQTQPGLPPEVAAAVLQSLAPSPADRFATVSEFAKELIRDG
jgi:hypothetical protein